jgi:gluconate 2-dehydrogenase gamma chain
MSRRKMLLYCSRAAMLNSIAAGWPAIAAGEHSHHAVALQAPAPGRLQFFTPEEAAEIDAICAQIIPTDDTPGAREAGVLYFIDSALATFDRDKQSVYRDGLKQVQAILARSFPGSHRLQDLTSDQQLKLIGQIEHSEFFETLRTHTIMGFFGNPSYGGNRNRAGWKLIEFEDKFVFEPPFGYYDSHGTA